MTQYTFDPPAAVEAKQFDYENNAVEVADWIVQQAGDDEEPRIYTGGWQMGIELGGRSLLVDHKDYVFFCDDKICKMSAQLFEYFFKVTPPPA